MMIYLFFLKKELGVELTDRKQVKQLVFQVLFTDNKFIAQEDAKPKRLFKQLYPTVYELFSLIKKKNKTLLPRLLQSIESWLILDKVCTKISKEYKALPIFTIHDSILTVKGHEFYVQQVMQEVVEKYVGYKPALDITYYNPDFLDGK